MFLTIQSLKAIYNVLISSFIFHGFKAIFLLNGDIR